MAKRANGTGTVRKVTRMIGGKKYEYWEARYTDGVDLGTGKQRRRSITGKTQKEVMQKLTAATAAIDSGTYIQPSKQTLGQWLDVWEKTYLGGVKPRTRAIYADIIRLHIKPALGAVRLEALNTHEIQQFYNALGEPSRTRKAGLAPKTIKDIHGVLHKALRQAVEIGYLRFNPADACKLPRVERKELAPLDDAQITAFLQTIKGSRFETLLTVTLFTGMREGEVLGLTWDNVDFKAGTVTISKQALLHESEAGGFQLGSTKNGKSRTIAPASAVMALLKQHKSEQAKQRLKVGKLWGNTALVFTDEIGRPLTKATVYRAFKKAATEIGRPDARFHDLRHSYAVAAIRSGDDIKTVQGNLGHATAAFTLDVYGHVTERGAFLSVRARIGHAAAVTAARCGHGCALWELQALIDEATAEAEALKDALKAAMGDAEEVRAAVYKITWKAVTSARIDTGALRKALPGVAAAFTKESTARRFCVA